MAEQQPPIPIIEHLPNGDNPHPSLEGAPQGTLGHADEALEHAPIEHEGKIIAAPEGHNAQIEVSGEKEADKLALKANPEEAERWGAEIAKRKREKEELPASPDASQGGPKSSMIYGFY